MAFTSFVDQCQREDERREALQHYQEKHTMNNRMKAPTEKQLMQQVSEFNNQFPVGDRVNFSELKGGPPKTFTIRTEAKVFGGHSAVVWLFGKSGFVDVGHCSAVVACDAK